MTDIMSKMSSIPNYDVLILDGLAVDPPIDASFVRRTHRLNAIINLRSSITKNPNVAPWKRPVAGSGGDAVVRAGNNVVTFPCPRVFHPPFPPARRIAGTADFKNFVMPV